MSNFESPAVNPNVAPNGDIAYIALGSNLGDRELHLAKARSRISRIPGVRVLAESVVEETAPIGPPGQDSYLNQMIAVQTTLAPPELLDSLLDIERQGGRIRDVRWGPRTIDLDIVQFERTTWSDLTLEVPHRELPNRDFWHRELAEVRATLVARSHILL